MRSRSINQCKHFDPACRNHGSDSWCTGSRLHAARKRISAAGVEDDATWEQTRAEADEAYRHRPEWFRSSDDPTEVALRVARAVQIRAEMRKRLPRVKHVPLTVQFLRDIGIERQESALDVFNATRGWRERATRAVLGDEE